MPSPSGRQRWALRAAAGALLAFAAVGVVGCPRAGRAGRDGRSGRDDRPAVVLHTRADLRHLDRRRALRRRVRADLHAYFRFVNGAFARRVCEAFRDETVPSASLHGDAHIQQYAVTEDAYGLVDFDDATIGPITVDLVRFGVSVRLTTAAARFGEDTALSAVLEGYRAALRDPDLEAPVPAVVARLRRQEHRSAEDFFAWAETVMEPPRPDIREAFDRSYASYVALMHERRPDLPEGYFDRVAWGRVRLGVGSAFTFKLLLRVRGPTDDPGDDLILEAKEARDLSAVPCVRPSLHVAADRVVFGQLHMGRMPTELLASVPLPESEDRPARLWIHPWFHDYRELDPQQDLRSAEELAEISYDVGVQLARGHTLRAAESEDPADAELALALAESVDRLEPRIRAVVGRLTGETRLSWERFRHQTD